MSNQVFPAFAGLGWSVTRTPSWKTRVQTSISGKETRIADWSYPRWQWDLTYDFLLQGTLNSQTRADFANLAGFFNARQGMWDSFLYQDSDDNAVTGQVIGTGDGITATFQLIRTFGNFIEPVTAPNSVSSIYLGGVRQSSGSYSVAGWGAASPGLVTFTAAPGAGVSIAADFTYYFPVRFVADQQNFEKFMQALYRAKKVPFISIK